MTPPAATPPLVLAHRGARRVAPENTIPAFTRALALGADGVELDVHRSADGGLVVHHDAEAEGVGVLAERTTGEIRTTRPDIPTLAEVLDACAGALVNVEIKNLPGDADFDPRETAAELVVGLLRERGGADSVVVSSFNLATIDRVRAIDDTVPTGFLAMLGLDPFDAVTLCADRGHGSFHPFFAMLEPANAESVIGRSHELGLRVHTWTVNEEADLRRLAAAGVDGIITDVPDVAVATLRG